MRSRFFIVFVLAAVLGLGTHSGSSAQNLFGSSDAASEAMGDVAWEVEPFPSTARAGETVMATFTIEVDEGWYLYSLDSPAGQALLIEGEALPEGFVWQEPLYQTTPTRKYDPNFDMDAHYFMDEAEVRAAVAIDEGLKPGTYEVEGSFRYMVCNDELCMPPRTEPFVMEVDVAEDIARDEYVAARWDGLVAEGEEVEVASEETPIGGEQAMSLWAFLLLAAGAGLGALLMPCVFPIIPLTVSYFTKHAQNKRAAGRLAGVYGLTIIATFTGLGALAAALLGAAGAQSFAANPWVNLAIGGSLFFFGLSFLGLFELRLPASWSTYFNKRSDSSGGYAGAMFMGLTLTIVSFSCTAPFVGGLLAAAAQGSWTYPLLGMLVFSTVLAVPFIGFALAPGWLERLPSSGGWMNTAKVTFGFIEMAAALKFFSNADLVWGLGLLPRTLVLALGIALALITALYLFGLVRIGADAPSSIGAGRVLAGTGALGLAIFMIPGLWGGPLGQIDAFLPPQQQAAAAMPASAPGSGASVHALNWHKDDLEGALATAAESGQPVFIDFTGYTCTNCRYMESNVFTTPQVAGHLQEDFVLLQLYTDDASVGPRFQEYQIDLTGTVALPTYAIVTPEEDVLVQHSGMANPDEFAAFLEEGLQASRM